MTDMGFRVPYPDPGVAIPLLLELRDVVGRPDVAPAAAAFGLPLEPPSSTDGARRAGLVLAPTRELAMQMPRRLKTLRRARPASMLSCVRRLTVRPADRKGPKAAQVVVGTSRRVIDLTRRAQLTCRTCGSRARRSRPRCRAWALLRTSRRLRRVP